MKTLSALFLLSLVSTAAFASHTYRSETCTSKKHELVYMGDKMIGGLYNITLKNKDQQISALPTHEVENETNTLENADVIFDTSKYKVIRRHRTTNDCWYAYESFKSKSIVQINLITPEASKALGLKKGDKITFTCEESIAYPVRGENSECKE